MKIIDIPKSVLELLDFRLNGTEPWPDPQEMEIVLEPVLPFDPELLPEVLRDFVFDNATRMQSPPDFVAVACLVAIGSVIGTGCAVRPKQHDDWYEYPNLWGGIVGGPSTMKTPSMNSGIQPIGWLESDADEAYKSEIVRYQLEKLDREYELKQLRSDKATTKLHMDVEQVRARIRELTATPLEEPKRRRYKTNDSTVEMLGELIRDNPRGMLVIRDELIGLLANCNRQGHEGDRSFYLEAWNGKHSFSVDRISRGSIVIDHLCLSIFGGIQPARLQDYVGGTVAGYDNDGLMQRFQLMVYPDEIKEWQYVDKECNTEARDKTISIARTLANADFVRMGAQQEAGKQPFFHFCPSAQKEFIKFLTSLEKAIRKVEHPIMAEHLSKYRKLIPALALIFHLVDLATGHRAKQPGISKTALQRAIRWGTYLESHARRIYGIGIDPVISGVRALAAKLKAGKFPDGFGERDVYKAGWSGLHNPDLVHAVCNELEQDGWLRRIPVKRGTGRPTSPSYEINPKLFAK